MARLASRSIVSCLGALLAGGIAAAGESPIGPLPSTASTQAVVVSMGDIRFEVPTALYSSLTSRGVEPGRFTLKLTLVPLEGADPKAARFLQAGLAYDASGKINQDHRQEMLDFSDRSSKRVDEHGFTHYSNPSGEWVEKQNQRGEWISMECSVSPPGAGSTDPRWPDVCSRDVRYSETIKLAYTFPRTYLSQALEIEASLLRIIDSLKVRSRTIPASMGQMVTIFTLDGGMHFMKDPGLPAPKKSQTATVAAEVGRKIILGTFTLVAAGCRVVDDFQVVVNEPPMNGAISGGVGETVVNFDPADQRFKCTGRKYKALALLYEAKAPGTDRMSILVPDLNRNLTEVHFAITAK
jgi:hypothetical protein